MLAYFALVNALLDAHHAVGEEEHEGDHQNERNHILKHGRQRQANQILGDAKEDAAEDGRRQASEAADDAGRKALQGNHCGHRLRDRKYRGDQYAQDTADHEADGDGDRDVQGNVDAHQGSRRLVQGHAGHGLAQLRVVHNVLKDEQHNDGYDDNDEVGDGNRSTEELRSARQEGQGVQRQTTPDQRRGLVEHLAQHDGRHDRDQTGLVAQRNKYDKCDQYAEQGQCEYCRDDGRYIAEVQIHEVCANEKISAQSDDLFMCEVQQAAGVVDQRVFDRDQRVHKAHGDATDDKLDQN